MSTTTQTAIEADPKLPVIRITREFAATPGQLFRAHTDPALFARWAGPDGTETRTDRIVQTFTYEAEPDGVTLETFWFEDLGGGRWRCLRWKAPEGRTEVRSF